MDKFIIKKPWKYDKHWLVFPNATFSHIDILDCDDTVRGVCIDDLTLSQCINVCELDSEWCGAGYHVQFKNGHSICAPLRTGIHPDLNPVHRLRKQSVYPAFDNVSVNTFINTRVYPFPPEQANVVFYRDIIILKNEESDLTLGSRAFIVENGDVAGFGMDTDLRVTLISSIRSASQVAMYRPVAYGDFFNINVANSALVLQQTGDNPSLEWQHSFGLSPMDFQLQILPIGDDKKIGDVVTYGDRFTIGYSGAESTAVVNPKYKIFEVYGGNYAQIKDAGKFFPTFSFISKMNGYYCDGDKCETVPIAKMEKLGKAGKYRGANVGRDPGCWGVCRYLIPGTNNITPFSSSAPPKIIYPNIKYIIIGLAVVLILVVLLIRFLRG